EVYGTYGDPLSVKLVDLIQKNLECCGPDGIWPVYLQQPPPASCFSPQGELYIDVSHSCVCALDEYLRKNITAIGICGLIFTVLNILALIFAICVCMALKSEVNNPEVICDPDLQIARELPGMASLTCGYKCLQCMLTALNLLVILCGIGLIIAGSIAEYNVVTYLSNDVSNLHAFVICIIVFGVLLTIIGIFGFFGACGKNICCLTVVASSMGHSAFQLQCCGPYGHWPIYLGLAAPYSCFDKNGYLYGQGCVDALNNYIKTNIVVIAICALVFTVLNLLALIFAVCVCMALKRGDDV
ncbi:tetraspanin family protein, partial [Opisthorchis viverrini]